MKTYVLVVSLLMMFTSVMDQKTDLKLEKLIQSEISNFQGDIGVYVHHLKKNKVVAIHADDVFPTASLVKIPILIGVFQKIAEGELTLDQQFRYDAQREYGGSGLMQFYKDSAQTDLSTMISLMLTYSDNVTSLWLQELSGGGQAINRQMENLGLKDTRVNSRTEGREEIREIYGWGNTTPRELSGLFELIRKGEIISPQYSDKMYRYLRNQFYNERALSQIPPTVNTISKTGSVNEARGEVVLVNAPGGDYVLCVLTKNNKDQSWTYENEAEVLTRKISNLVWNYYEPRHPFKPFQQIK